MDRIAPGRLRIRSDAVLGNNAYSSKAIRAHLRARGITSCIPEPSDQRGHRKRRGYRGGRPVSYDKQLRTGCNVVESSINDSKQWRSQTTRYDSSSSSTGPEHSSAPSPAG